MQKKQGISLIVLVITIIVMIILAAAVVISLNNTGIIDKANYAVQLTDKKQAEDLAALDAVEIYTEDTVYSLAELKEVFAEGGNVVLGTDITVTADNMFFEADGGHSDGSAFFVKEDTVINLNGHDIKIEQGNPYGDVFFMNWGATLTIEGNGEIIADCGIFCAIDADSTINVKGGKFSVTASNDMFYAVNGKINISGGTFESTYSNIINIYGSGRNQLVDVSGGTFKNWNPASAPDGNLLADGYKSVSETVDGVTWYTVVAE